MLQTKVTRVDRSMLQCVAFFSSLLKLMEARHFHTRPGTPTQERFRMAWGQ
jgi:hypothetical protein